MNLIQCEGRMVYLASLEEQYFPYIIDWRNNPENNRYLNQPFVLTMDKQCAWYETYLTDSTQGLLIVVDRETDTPFATMGWTDHNPVQRFCITGRLLVGDRRYRGSIHFAEASMLFADYVYGTFDVDTCYAHIACDNIASIRYHEKYGFHRNDGAVQFPHELTVNGMQQGEYVRSREDWLSVRENVVRRLAQSGVQRFRAGKECV